jgi:hypothetical protein
MLRRPKTTQERRVNGKRTDRREYKIRARRNAANLPEAWDDIWATTQRSWKKHRKKQYK